MASNRSSADRRVDHGEPFDVVRDRGADAVEDDDPRQDHVDIVVAQIKRLTRNATLEYALRVGAVIIHHFYDGDTEAWRSRGPKTASFRRLAQRPDLPLSAGSLYRCVALFELCDRLNAPSRWEHLGASHLRLVLGLPPSTQERLLAVANAQRWTVKVLQQHVLRNKSSRLTSGGRCAQLPLAKSLRSVQKCLEDHRRNVLGVERLTIRDVEQTLALVEEARSSLDRLSLLLRNAATVDNDDEAYQPLEQRK
jgi:hypothetical protein